LNARERPEFTFRPYKTIRIGCNTVTDSTETGVEVVNGTSDIRPWEGTDRGSIPYGMVIERAPTSAWC
jgi:hypothetical protein